MRALASGSIVLLALAASLAAAEPLAREDVPEPLAPWVEWVLRGHESERCPFLDGSEQRACVWPAELELEVEERTGRFTQRWWVHHETAVTLPGDARRWPEDVRADGRPVIAVERAERPSVRLGPGSHVVSGSFRWDAPPELLQVPPETGIVRLRVRGRDVAAPDRDAEGRLWLVRRAAPDGAPANLELSVHRRVSDEVPLLVETRVQLRVAGRGREVRLGRALPESFEPLALDAPLPARLDPDGHLRVQVRPGTWELTLLARHVGPVREIALSDPAGPWDTSEEWVFEAHPELRLVTLEGVDPIDPAQTQLPDAWRHLPAYPMEPGRALRLVEKRRGDSDPAPDQLALARVWWLDFDGSGATVSDALTGSLRRSTRLEMQAPGELGRAALGGRDQRITRLEPASPAGVEVPPGPLELGADSRVAASGALVRRLPAVGWDADVQALEATLHLPPGWRLFHVRGADAAHLTWIETWNLLDVFVVLVLAFAFERLWGVRWGAVALAGLALTWTERGAPHWLWGAVLAGEALLRVLPAARVPRFTRAVELYRGAALALLVLAAIPFAVREIRAGIFPALEQPGAAVDTRGLALGPPLRAPASEGIEAMAVTSARARDVADKVASLGGPLEYTPDPKASITTGPGLPSWTWTQVRLGWSGPVRRDQTLSLVLLPPAANGVLAFVRVGLLAALLLCVLGIPPARVQRLLAGALACAALLVPAGSARADLPSPDLLDELRRRLLEPPDCRPRCAEIARLALDAQPQVLRLRLDAHAQAETALALPGGALEAERVWIDGEPAAALLRAADGTLWARIGPGRHDVVLEGSPRRDSLEIALPARPHRVDVQANGWIVRGVHEDGQPEATLALERVRAAGEALPALERGDLPPFVRVTRRVQLDLEWRALTQVQRLSPAGAAIALEIPLLPGESVTSPDVRAEDGRAHVSMGPGVTSVVWASALAIQPELALRAPAQVSSTEVWRLEANPIWHLDLAGIPPLHQPGARIREWQPWPGEELRISVRRPEGIEGATATLDRAALALTLGLRATDAQLSLALRSSRGGQHAIALPEGAELQRVHIDGVEQAVRQEQRQVVLPLRPGAQAVELAWREPRGARSLVYRGSAVDLGMPAVNAEVHVTPSPARWTLLTGGPRLGPSVLFWPLLIVLLGVAFALARISEGGLTPLRLPHWIGLGLGLTQVPVAAAAVVAVWLLALGWRARSGTRVRGRWFDLVQLGLAVLTLAALSILFFAIGRGLLGTPSMQIAGNGSSAELLRWYQDRSGAQLPQPWLASVPLSVYRAAMFAWALWLARALVGWLRWAWTCFAAGELWRPLRRTRVEA